MLNVVGLITGYLRVVFALAAFSVANLDPLLFVAFYFGSFACDELDGRFARKFNQTSIFGAVLDMVTDRVATCGLISILCAAYQSWQPVLVGLMMLDVFSHWFQMYATLASGNKTHKDVKSHSFLVRFYYQHRLFMGFCCVCVEVLYLLLYLLSKHEMHGKYIGYIPLPVQVVSELREKWNVCGPNGCPLLGVLAAISVPGFLFKQAINVVQLKNASQQLVELEMRRER